MKSIRLLFSVAGLAMILLVLTSVVSSTSADSSAPISKANMMIASPASEALITQGNIKLDPTTNVPRRISQVDFAVSPGTPQEMAEEYLRANTSLLQLKNSDLSDLRHQFTHESLAGATVRYDQTYNGVPIYKSQVVVHINNESKVSYVMSDYVQTLKGINTTPRISAELGREIGHLAVNPTGKLHFDKTELVIFPTKTENILTYRVRVQADLPHGEWEIMVDAQTGDVIRVEDIMLYEENPQNSEPSTSILIDGTATIFDPDPLTTSGTTYNDPGFTDGNDATTPQLDGEMVTRPLRDITLTGSTYSLEGPNAFIVDWAAPNKGVFSQTSLNWTFNRFDDAFEAANVYYHLDDMMRYYNNTIGCNVTPIQYTTGVQADPHGFNGADNSSYSPGTGQLQFGEGGVDDAEDSDVIHHELGHGFHDWLTGGNLSQVNGLSEGLGDYFAASYNRRVGGLATTDPAYDWVFRWDGHNDFWNGRVTDYNDSISYPGGMVGQIHTDGQLWASCMLDVGDAIGIQQADQIMCEGIAMTGASTSQDDAANAVYQAALDLGLSGADIQQINSILSGCGYNMPQAAGVTIEKTASPDPVPVGGIITYNIDVTNSPIAGEGNVVITDAIPAGTTIVPGSLTCGTVSGGVITINVGAMTAGQVQNCTYQVMVSNTAIGATIVFDDDMESGGGNWTASAGTGTNNWALGTTNPYSGSSAWFAQDVSTVTDQYLTLNSGVMLMGGEELQVWHAYDTEATYDGGVMEISTDGGVTWTDLGGNMTQNGYSGAISTCCSNPIGGQPAFEGNSNGYVQTIVDLNPYAGSTVIVRFRMATDSSVTGNGWWVDDVTITKPGDVIVNTACVTSDSTAETCSTTNTPVEATDPLAIALQDSSVAGSNVSAVFAILVALLSASTLIVVKRRQSA